MTGSKSIPTLYGGRYLAAALATGAALLAGCANMQSTATTIAGQSADAALVSGAVKGGNQPVQFATVQLYTVGQSGYGSAGTLLASTATNAGGNFGFSKGTSYTCPTGADPYVYIKVTGGNTTGNGSTSINNTASVFLAPLGLCSQITSSTFVNISEVTTVATVAALSAYINPSTESIGANGTSGAYVGVGNAFKTIPNLVSQATGLANTSITLGPANSGYNVSTVTITGTPEAAKLNTLANILSACINQTTGSATNCTNLFAAAVPPTTAQQSHTAQGLVGLTFPSQAADTLQAALYIFLNPTDTTTTNRTNLYNLAPATGAPYQPTLTAVPTDWSLAISYATTNTCNGTTSSFFSQPYDLGFDNVGNLWVSNAPSAGGYNVEISNSGTPTSCITTVAKGISGGKVDQNGNIWYTDSGSNTIYRFVPTTSSIITSTNPANSQLAYTTAAPPLSIAFDSVGDVFFTCVVNGVGSVYEIINGASANFTNSPTLISNTVGPNPAGIFPDNATDLFVTSGSSYVTELSPATGGPNFVGGYTSTQISGIPSPTYGVTVGPQNRVYITSQDPGASLTVLAPIPNSASYGIVSGFPTATNIGGLSNPVGIAIDGGQNSFVANGLPESTSGNYALTSIATDGTPNSVNGNTNGGYQKSTTYFNKMRGVAVDSSGNVWVTNDNNANSITEIVGLGTPIGVPYSVTLQKKTFQSIP